MGCKQKGPGDQIQGAITTPLPHGGNLGNVNPDPGISGNMNILNGRNTDDKNQNYRPMRRGSNYWAGSQAWGQNPGPASRGKGSFDNGESRNSGGRTPRIDHGCKVYKDSECALKTDGVIS